MWARHSPLCGVTLLAGLIVLGCESQPELPPTSGTGSPEDQHLSYLREAYDKTEHMVAMRDGVELYTIVYTPKDRSHK